MEKYFKQGTSKTPFVNFDFDNGLFEISGRSIPENSYEFYKPILSALEEYIKCAQYTTTISISLDYFSTSSSKCLLDLMKKLETLKDKGKNVIVNWHYQDEEILEAGEDYQTMTNLPFQMVQIAE